MPEAAGPATRGTHYAYDGAPTRLDIAHRRDTHSDCAEATQLHCGPLFDYYGCCRPVPLNSGSTALTVLAGCCARLVLHTAITAPVWRGGSSCFYVRSRSGKWIPISAALYSLSRHTGGVRYALLTQRE